jgi:hypothetical protein
MSTRVRLKEETKTVSNGHAAQQKIGTDGDTRIGSHASGRESPFERSREDGRSSIVTRRGFRTRHVQRIANFSGHDRSGRAATRCMV